MFIAETFAELLQPERQIRLFESGLPLLLIRFDLDE
jgi:hypothetical protein